MIIRSFMSAGAVALAINFASTPPEAAHETPAAVWHAAGARLSETPPPPWGQAGPADSLYRLGRDAINRNDFRRAAALFGEITAKYPRSEYAPDAPYWRAFALYKLGREDDLREALKALEAQRERFPRASTIADARELTIRIRGELAQKGDVASAEAVSRAASQNRPCDETENEIRAAALNALLQMDAESAVPIIKQVLEKRDVCWAPLREKAVFILSQKRTSETETIMLDVLTNDPSRSVREQAVFWMGQVRTDKAAEALEQLAMSSTDVEMRRKAIHALHEQNTPRGIAVIRRLAESTQTPEQVRSQAIFWLGQRGSPENAEFLRGLFGRIPRGDEELRKQVLFSLSQMRGYGNDRWLLNVALDGNNSSEVRGHAIWTAGQAGIPGADLAALYDRVTDTEIKEKLIWVMSESRDRAGTDKLVEIAQRDRDIEMRKKALFWLGQKNDPRIRQLLSDILTRP